MIVGAIGPNTYVREWGVDSLDLIKRLVPEADVARAKASTAKRAAADTADVTAWLAHCRWIAGIDTDPPETAVPTGFEIPPLPEQGASLELADRHGSSWWTAFKKADELGRPEQEVYQLREIARGWYRIRDAAAKTEQLSSVKSAATEEQLDQAIRDVEHGKDIGDVPGYFLGKFMADWLRYVEELAKTGEGDRALALDYALITVAEREAAVSGREPAPAYTERAAILHRKRKEYREEIAVIERWENACPPERRGPGATQAKLSKRLGTARELLAKQSAPTEA